MNTQHSVKRISCLQNKLVIGSSNISVHRLEWEAIRENKMYFLVKTFLFPRIQLDSLGV